MYSKQKAKIDVRSVHILGCDHMLPEEIIDADGSGTLQITELVRAPGAKCIGNVNSFKN